LSTIRCVCLRLAGLVALSCAASPARAGYIVSDLGALNYAFPLQASINNAGQVAAVGNPNGLYEVHGYLYAGGTRTDLGALGSTTIGGQTSSYTIPNAINDAGQVVGSSTTDSGASHGFLFSHGTLKDLGVLGGKTIWGMFFSASGATGINAAGQIVGTSTTNQGTPKSIFYHAFLYVNGVMKDLGVLSGKPIGGQAATSSYAAGINSAGQVVGYSGWDDGYSLHAHAFLSEKGAMKDLGVLGRFTTLGFTEEFSRATAINNVGQIVGASTTATGATHAFLYASGAMKDLGSFGAQSTPFGTFDYSSANAINSLGEAVGGTTTSTGFTAFIYRNGHMLDLNALLPPGSGWRITEATGINDQGQIVGRALDAHGQFHLVELTATVAAAPEPGCLLLSGVGAFSLLVHSVSRLRRKRQGLAAA
jgi:probable HAF family extracellular repeat protein